MYPPACCCVSRWGTWHCQGSPPPGLQRGMKCMRIILCCLPRTVTCMLDHCAAQHDTEQGTESTSTGCTQHRAGCIENINQKHWEVQHTVCPADFDSTGWLRSALLRTSTAAAPAGQTLPPTCRSTPKLAAVPVLSPNQNPSCHHSSKVSPQQECVTTAAATHQDLAPAQVGLQQLHILIRQGDPLGLHHSDGQRHLAARKLVHLLRRRHAGTARQYMQ